ncbi:MAG TPA: hypothetical protein PLH92_10895 [Mycobacterium sp.]|nr:hypothetical protein [Mycobacterium sp.]HQC77212.1 hypothetical protein [Mycobacterium sp.]
MSIISKKLLAAGLLTAGATLFAGAPAAFAAPLPEPEPVPVGPVDGVSEAPIPGSDGQIRVSAPEVGVTGGESEATGAPVEAVPNINGDSCTGGWESTVCYAEQQGDSPPEVQPRTSISSSP